MAFNGRVLKFCSGYLKLPNAQINNWNTDVIQYNLHLWQIIEAMQAVLLAEVQRTMNTLRKTAICREPLAIVENGNGKWQTLPETE